MLETTAILLGEGRVRKVFLAEHDGQPVAVKVLQRQGDIRLHRIELATLDAVSCASQGTVVYDQQPFREVPATLGGVRNSSSIEP